MAKSAGKVDEDRKIQVRVIERIVGHYLQNPESTKESWAPGVIPFFSMVDLPLREGSSTPRVLMRIAAWGVRFSAHQFNIIKFLVHI